MSAQNKARGSRWEIASEEHAINAGIRAKRLPRAGVNDIGDMSIELKSGLVIVTELKDWVKPSFPEFLRQAAVEAEHYEAKYRTPTVPAVLSKLRGKGPGKGLFMFHADDFYDFLHAEGLLP